MRTQVRRAAPKGRGDPLNTLYTGMLSNLLVEMGHMNQALKPFVRWRGFSKVTLENHTRDELGQGTLHGDVYWKYGVL